MLYFSKAIKHLVHVDKYVTMNVRERLARHDSRSSLNRDLSHVLTSHKVEKLLSALAVLMGTAGAADCRLERQR